MKTPLVSRFQQKEFWENIKNRRTPFHPAVKAFAKPKVNIVSGIIQSPKARLLEVGCGNGFFTTYLKDEWDVTALDRSKKMLLLNPYKCIVQGEVERLPFGDESNDIVFSTNLLHHIEEPLTATKEMARVSKKYVVLVEPNRNNPLMFLFSSIKKEERGAVKFSQNYLVSLIEQTGLHLLHSCSHGSVVPNKTPKFLVPLLEPFNKKIPLGFYIMAIGQKIDGKGEAV